LMLIAGGSSVSFGGNHTGAGHPSNAKPAITFESDRVR
jgi:hypothetical protein